MKTIKEMIREAASPPLRIDRAIIKISEEEHPVIKIDRLKTACMTMNIKTIAERLSYLETKGLINVYHHREKEIVKIHSIELTAFGKAVAKDDHFMVFEYDKN